MNETTVLKNSIVLPNDVQQVPRLAEFVEGICEQADIDMATTFQLNLAIEEAVVNVMNYAYPPGVVGEVMIEASVIRRVTDDADDVVDDNRLSFVIRDSGVAFDPTKQKEVDTTLSAEERSVGGLGIHLVKKIMDSVDYKRVDNSNVLVLSKSLGARSQQ